MVRSKKKGYAAVAQPEDAQAHGHRMSEFDLGSDAGLSDGDLVETSGESQVSP